MNLKKKCVASHRLQNTLLRKGDKICEYNFFALSRYQIMYLICLPEIKDILYIIGWEPIIKFQ